MPPQLKFLKTAFNIPVTKDSNTPLDLLIEIGQNGIACMWLSNHPLTVQGLVMYHLEENDQLPEMLTSIFESPAMTAVTPSSVHICYNFKESLLVPDLYHEQGLNCAMLSLMFGEQDAALVETEAIARNSFHNVYRVPAEAAAMIKKHFQGAVFHHSTSLQLTEKVKEDLLQCIVFHNCIKVILHKDGQLQLVQQFGYSKPDDVAYHLINTCQQHNCIPGDIKLRLCGMVDRDSILYNRLHNYFLHIDFAEIAPGINVQEAISDLPAHFFSHLTNLAACVL